MKTKIRIGIVLYLFLIGCLNISGQGTLHYIDASQVSKPNIYDYCGRVNLPFYYDKTPRPKTGIKGRNVIQENDINLNRLPAVFNPDIRYGYKETNSDTAQGPSPYCYKYMFMSNGNYILLGITFYGGYEVIKNYLCTVNLNFELIDFLEVNEYYNTGDGYMLMQSVINSDLTIDRNEIKVSGTSVMNYYDITSFTGQREDKKFKINSQGGFELIEQKVFAPKDYLLSQMKLNDYNIREGNEVPN